MRFVFAFLACVLMTAPVFAADPFTFSDAFVRATPAKISAGYVSIANHSGKDDTLQYASATWADHIQIHGVKTDKAGTMDMFAMPDLEIKKDQTVSLSPGGTHFMIFDLKDKLIAGQKRIITLHFTKAGDIQLPVIVQPITYQGKKTAKPAAAKAPAPAMGDMDDMPGMHH